MASEINITIRGIAQVLEDYRLRVPLNQREYSWTDEYVERYLSDLTGAMRKSEDEPYFLGTIVLMRSAGDLWEVADGQQRLATTTMILSAIRDCYHEMNNDDAAGSITSRFLYRYDTKERGILPRLSLNTDDNSFFMERILKFPGKRTEIASNRHSHELLTKAAEIIGKRFKSLESESGPRGFDDELIRWEDFLKRSGKIVVAEVSDSRSAFIMFETLNDRGLQTNQADLVKNHLFDKAGDRRDEAHVHWSRMRGAIDSIGEKEDDLTLEFLRLACCVLTGRTTETEIMERVQQHTANKMDAIKLIALFDDLSAHYAAILNSDSPRWNGYQESIRKSIKTIDLLGVKQIRPLMLAVARYFEPQEAARAFRRFVSWSVRFKIVGGRGGKLDEGYALRANEIFSKVIKTDQDLALGEKDFVPTDAVFRSNFRGAKVNVAKFARYYLRALELTHLGETYPEYVPAEEGITIEHIMSQVPNSNVTEQDIETHSSRLGNMVLLRGIDNAGSGSDEFDKKKPILKASAYALTAMTADNERWGVKEIEIRQAFLADLAVKTWKL